MGFRVYGVWIKSYANDFPGAWLSDDSGMIFHATSIGAAHAQRNALDRPHVTQIAIFNDDGTPDFALPTPRPAAPRPG
jgi:hypothetical protein